MSDPSSSRADPPYRYGPALAEAIERKWQARWAAERTFRTPQPGEPDFDPNRPRYYVLDMFPYPSGAGLHVGHPEGYTATDILARYKRMKGFQVLHPMGWDAFGLPAEQYAIATGVHPAQTTRQSIDTFRRQLQRFGFSYDWDREIATIDPDYYRWTQWIFLQIYDAWFDPVRRRARRIAELVAEFERGERPVAINPDAAEYSDADKAVRHGPWSTLDEASRRRIVDSWRLAYVAEQTVNWCPALGTVLANDEVIDGHSERGGHPVHRRPLRQWHFRITAYAERLLEGLSLVDWPESTRQRQIDWIGRSEGADIDFPLVEAPAGWHRLRVFTTRPDTLFGATFMVVAPEHPLVDAVLRDPGSETDVERVRAYVQAARDRGDVERQASRAKTGVPLGVLARNPATGERIPVWTADYVLASYGHGAIMAVPSGDERDYQFAREHGLRIVRVVVPVGAREDEVQGCYAGEGICVNSRGPGLSIDGLATNEARRAVVGWLEREGLGRGRVTYRLRDWAFSRQRYWGEPFPIVWDAQGRHHPVSERALPVRLPPLVDFAPEPSDEPRPLLARARDWVQTTAGEAGVDGLPPETPVWRETNTMPGSAGSSWYWIRFCDPRNATRFVGEAAEAYWLGERGVDLYVGGSEHAVGHLLYARFWNKVLKDLGLLRAEEPFARLFHQGLITSYAYERTDGSLVASDEVDEVAEDRFVERATGQPVRRIVAKMSKSLKNVVNPDEVIAAWGADCFRLYEMYMGPLEASKPWNTRDMAGMARFLGRFWRLAVDECTGALRLASEANERVERALHRTIAKVEADIEKLSFHTAIAAMIELVHVATDAGGMSRDQLDRFARILAPFAPHVCEEVWERLGHERSIAFATWPTHDPALLREADVEIPVQVGGRVRARLRVAVDTSRQRLEQLALEEPRVREALGGRPVARVVVVPGKLVNVVPASGAPELDEDR
ncbi:MAG: leucine--tRNA ligase [Myxococcota bacterium]|nr:leucine--tRNA ligase [Myxococcota bacterium]MDW8363173.1 leucine--tRNA ligase [Myxococcales bacterium]